MSREICEQPFCEHSETTLSAADALETLRQLSGDIRAIDKASVFCRYLLGKHLISIQKQGLWAQMERRDYRSSPGGKPLWLNEKDRTYSSWYNFLEEGFECTTGLGRQTAYSAIKMAHSSSLSKLTRDELTEFKRLANVLEVVALERNGVTITPTLLAQAQDLPIRQFRQVVRGADVAVAAEDNLLRDITRLLRLALAHKPSVVNLFWDVLQDAMVTAKANPADALETVVEAYSAGRHSCHLLITSRKPIESVRAAGTSLEMELPMSS